ncbi:MAG: hypothetical protein JRJ20_04155 [Deltaproteobacteria bacterium]|nr:hypothetical protein [Deltaproteobacteria bacterium]
MENKQQRQVRQQWTISKQEATRILSNKRFTVNPGSRANTGLFSIGPKVNWLYSKKLYPEAIYVEDHLREILKTASN